VEATRNLRALKAAIIGSEEPADAELAPGQTALWFSPAVGMVRMKGKTLENTIIRGQVILA
jgi:hypothetical protein